MTSVLVAPDKFKGSLSATEVARNIAAGIRSKGLDVVALPLADGGDGSVDAALAVGFSRHSVRVASATGVLHEAVIAFDGRTAVVEVANTVGLALLKGRKSPSGASSFGFGQAVRFALSLRPQRLVLALGGSASTDGGAGLLTALGARLNGRDGEPVPAGGGSLSMIETADLTGLVLPAGVEIIVATDVTNPLLGLDGAAQVYAPQKGADAAGVMALDAGLGNFVDRLADSGLADARQLAAEPGAGAAGGLGFACLLLGGRIVSGADFFLDLVDFDNRVQQSDAVVTGEGALDSQTLMGKLVSVVADRSRGRACYAVVGRNSLDADQVRTLQLERVYSVSERCTAEPTLGNPMRDRKLTERLLREFGEDIAQAVLGSE